MPYAASEIAPHERITPRAFLRAISAERERLVGVFEDHDPAEPLRADLGRLDQTERALGQGPPVLPSGGSWVQPFRGCRP